MAHMIDLSTGRAGIAYVNAVPWHGLGQQLTDDAPLEVWQKEAGLDWTAERAAAIYRTPDGVEHAAPRDVLYRSDTKSPLGIVSKTNYHPVQPAEVMEFFRDLTERQGFKMEVAGSLRDGKRIWALARVGANAVVGKEDEVAPYLLLSTAFDGTAGTVAQFTNIRVVCNNTISAADRENAQRVNVWHCTKFDANAVKMDMGLVTDSFAGMMERFNALAKRRVGSKQVDDVLAKLLDIDTPEALAKSRGYQKIMGLFEGGAIGSELKGVKGTAWGLLNSVTEYVDHHAGLSQDTRMNSAWFGKGNTMKSNALELVTAL